MDYNTRYIEELKEMRNENVGLNFPHEGAGVLIMVKEDYIKKLLAIVTNKNRLTAVPSKKIKRIIVNSKSQPS